MHGHRRLEIRSFFIGKLAGFVLASGTDGGGVTRLDAASASPARSKTTDVITMFTAWRGGLPIKPVLAIALQAGTRLNAVRVYPCKILKLRSFLISRANATSRSRRRH